MSDVRIKVRANRSTGELEIEGPAAVVEKWWDKLWASFGAAQTPEAKATTVARQSPPALAQLTTDLPEVFGEFFHGFRSDISDVDRVLIAGAFIQARDPDRVFTTKSANQLLIDQNIKLTNPSESVRRLLNSKRSFVVTDGRFRVSAGGFDHLMALKSADE